MSGQKKNNSGTLGTNRRKEKETHPTHSGQCVIDGKEFWISAWVRESDHGRFFSLAFQPKRASEHAGGTANPPGRTASTDDFNDPVPF